MQHWVQEFKLGYGARTTKFCGAEKLAQREKCGACSPLYLLFFLYLSLRLIFSGMIKWSVNGWLISAKRSHQMVLGTVGEKWCGLTFIMQAKNDSSSSCWGEVGGGGVDYRVGPKNVFRKISANFDFRMKLIIFSSLAYLLFKVKHKIFMKYENERVRPTLIMTLQCFIHGNSFLGLHIKAKDAL